MWSLTACVATLAGPIHVIRLRRAQGLPNHPVFTVGWVLGLLAASVAPWVLASAVDPDGSMGNLREAWVIGLPIGLVLVASSARTDSRCTPAQEAEDAGERIEMFTGFDSTGAENC